MAGNFSDYLSNKILNFIFNGTVYTPPTTMYLALYTTAPTSAGGGTEVTGGAYARVPIPVNSSNFSIAISRVTALATLKDFVAASAPWGSVVALGLHDQLSGGNLLVWDDFLATSIVAMEIVRVNAGQLTVSLP